MLRISELAHISPLADIEASQRGTLIDIADGVVIDAFVKIKPVGGLGELRIGRGSYINSGCVLYTGNGLIIGEDVLIAANCTLAPVNHAFRDRHRKIIEQRFEPSRGGILIEDDVWIGANSVLLDGSILRRGSVVGANSLVMGELEPYSIHVGSPARVVGYRN
jgi:virginiamycin A acetyltransferase